MLEGRGDSGARQARGAQHDVRLEAGVRQKENEGGSAEGSAFLFDNPCECGFSMLHLHCETEIRTKMALLIIILLIVAALCFCGVLTWEVIYQFCVQGYGGWVLLILGIILVIWLLCRD